jgi:4-hydroxy-tetrahydrodipicolinate reductase
MNIALIGYGKMGKTIEKVLISKGHQVTIKVGKEGVHAHDFNGIDVAIEFSKPELACENVLFCLEHDIPVVCGTTAWDHEMQEAINICHRVNGSFLYASNFSIGVNMFFEINKFAAKLMQQLTDYQVNIEEIHHTAKLDTPSGTAISLAKQIIERNENLESWTMADDAKSNQLPIVAKRVDPAPGTHIITYQSEIDSIQLTHTAHSRNGFAQGAVLAAEWLHGKNGVFSMSDVLNIVS